MFLIFIFIHSYITEFNSLLNYYNIIEEQPRIENKYSVEIKNIWEDIIYLNSPEQVYINIQSNITDTSRQSVASLTSSAHFCWALKYAEDFIENGRIGSWIGNLYPVLKYYKLTEEDFIKHIDWIYNDSLIIIVEAGCRWSKFFLSLDANEIEWIKCFQGANSINEISQRTGISRIDITLFCLELAKIDMIYFEKEVIKTNYINYPDTLNKIYGFGFFFIGE